MRIPEKQKYSSALSRIEKAKNHHATILNQLASHKAIQRISDDPIGAVRRIQLRNDIHSFDQYDKNIRFSLGSIQTGQQALLSIHEKLIRVRELAVAMANDTYDANNRLATAKEIAELKKQVLHLANSTYNDHFVFSGFRSRTPTINREGHFIGDDGAIFVQIDKGEFRQINLQARYLFEPTQEGQSKGQLGMVRSIDVLYQGLIYNDKNLIYQSMTELDRHINNSSIYQAILGTVENGLTDISKKIEFDQERSRMQLSFVEDVDIFKASSDLKQTENILQSTLMASNKLLQPSLLDFMR